LLEEDMSKLDCEGWMGISRWRAGTERWGAECEEQVEGHEARTTLPFGRGGPKGDLGHRRPSDLVLRP
jgi:hypothetical protein